MTGAEGSQGAAHARATPFRTLPLDVAVVRSEALLRRTGAVVVSAGAAWVLLASPGLRLGALAVAALGIAGMWLRRARPQHAAGVALRLEPGGLALGPPDAEPTPWAEILAIDVDEDRLTVRIDRRGAPPLHLEPSWGGLSVYALADAVRAARQAAP